MFYQLGNPLTTINEKHTQKSKEKHQLSQQSKLLHPKAIRQIQWLLFQITSQQQLLVATN